MRRLIVRGPGLRGPRGLTGPAGPQGAASTVPGPQGLPGVNAIPADEFVAGLVNDDASDTRVALDGLIRGGAGAAAAVLALGYGLEGDTQRTATEKAPTIGPNLWQTQYFSPFAQEVGINGVVNTTTTTPTITGDSTTKSLRTRIDLRNIRKGNSTLRFRIAMDVTTTAVVGPQFLSLNAGFLKADGTQNSYYDARRIRQTAATNIITISPDDTLQLNAHRFMFEVDGDNFDGDPQAYLEVYLTANANVTGGSISLTNVDIREVPNLSPLLRIGWDRPVGVNASVYAEIPQFDNALLPRVTSYRFGPDNAVGVSMIDTQVSYDAAVGSSTRFRIAQSASSAYRVGIFNANNTDMIQGVIRGDGELELRGNTHGGETGRSGDFATDYRLYVDLGNGAWTQITGYDVYAYNAFKAKIVTQTKLTRSDQSSPYANVDRTFYIYPDGTVRKDFTVTFLQNQGLAQWFWDMSSFEPSDFRLGGAANAYRGRLGRGQLVVSETDLTTRLAAPVHTAPATATTGGSIGGGYQYGILVTALNVNGETTPGLASNLINIPAGSNTNTATANWNAVTGATGYAIYFGLPGYEKRVATVPAGTTTYTVTGAELPGQAVPIRNTAVKLLGSDHLALHNADWAVYYDRTSNACYSMAMDHSAIAAQTGLQGVVGRLQRVPGITKNYWSVEFEQDSINPYVVPNGTVYNGTTYRFIYFPKDVDQFEREQTIRGAAIQQLGDIYPTEPA